MDTNHTSIIDYDPYLQDYRYQIDERRDIFVNKMKDIDARFGSLQSFASWHEYMGFHWEGSDCVYREWAPNARALSLVGDFNNWNRNTHPLEKKEHGIWEIRLPSTSLPHLSQVKVSVESNIGIHARIPSFIRYVVQKEDHSFNAVVWNPSSSFQWTDKNFKAQDENLLIYEAHVGMATEEEKVGSYEEFTEHMLPYISDLGYNCIQLMGIMEHPYYGSFGYHVSNCYAVSSRFGTPDEFKHLVDTAHAMGISIIIDLVHSHAVKNFYEGLNLFDGSEDQFFHKGTKGNHELWDSKLYNYGKEEVQRYLLSNVKYWMEEYHLDGFRFDGITSMLYTHHGLSKDFVNYDMYFKHEVDHQALLYLQLTNELICDIKTPTIRVAEDMSGMPGLCRPPEEGGVGFSHRLAMGVPDAWIKIIKEQKDEDWDVFHLFHLLCDRRYKEKSISYCESHDQAIVGDKTIAFRLMDQEMYWNMDVHSESLIIDRGIALHKLIRLFTMTLGGESYLTFMGNEFGHPEWIDFPRQENKFSYFYARRQWSLQKNEDLRYRHLYLFEKAMIGLARTHNILEAQGTNLINFDVDNKIILFEKANCIFVFSFNPHNSIQDYEFGVPESGDYVSVLSSDDAEFGGFDRIDTTIKYVSQRHPMHGYAQSIKIYITNRTALVLRKI